MTRRDQCLYTFETLGVIVSVRDSHPEFALVKHGRLLSVDYVPGQTRLDLTEYDARLLWVIDQEGKGLTVGLHSNGFYLEFRLEKDGWTREVPGDV